MKRSKTSSYKKINGRGDRFYVLPVSDDQMREYIDLIRLISSHYEKHRAHITVRGPYKKKLSSSNLKNFNGKLKGNLIRIKGVGNFFKDNQNTVFFECDGTHLKDVWKKKDFGYTPHITVYDGENAEFAKDLYKTLKRYEFDLSFKAEKLDLFFGAKKQNSMELQSSIGDDLIRRYSHVNIDSIERLSFDKKLEIIDRVSSVLSSLSKRTDKINKHPSERKSISLN